MHVQAAQQAYVAAMAQWLLMRDRVEPAVLAPSPAEPVLEVTDGATLHRVPAREIEQVTAAGNYVELAWHGRVLLHRATLAAVEAVLGPAFARIHRSRLVRREAVRRRVTLRVGNLTSPVFLAGEPAFDAVFCRNLFIYLTPAARRACPLAPGGAPRRRRSLDCRCHLGFSAVTWKNKHQYD